MEIGLSLTQRCNAQCTHCATDSGPSKERALGIETIFALMDEAARLTPQGEKLDFSLTGGEVFLNLEYLIDVVRHAAGLGGRISCVTNAYWASSDQKAEAISVRVRNAGLTALAASTSRYHQRFVPIDRVRRALSAARAAGMLTLLKIAYTVPDLEDGLVDEWGAFVGADQLQTFAVVPYLREGGEIPPEHYVRVSGLPSGTCPAPSLSVREDGAAYTCCTPGAFQPLLRVGNVFSDSLREIVARFHFDPMLQALREKGPAYFAHYAIARGQGARLRDGYADECDLCAHIISDPVLAQCAQDSAREYRMSWASRISTQMRAGQTAVRKRRDHNEKERKQNHKREKAAQKGGEGRQTDET
jgi:pyruvate-formate lyase-activating enzyme